MNFNYQLYVNRLKYEAFQWPPDISLAELHSRVSEQGPVNEHGVKCPCCNYQSKKRFSNWLTRDVGQDCSHLGSAVPAYFGLLKFYIVAILLVILINGIYPVWALYYTCQNFNASQSCLKVGLFYYLNFDQQLELLVDNNSKGIADILVILQTVNYYILTFVNLGSLWYLFYMQKKEEGLYLDHTEAAKNALIIGNIPSVDPQVLKEKINVSTRLQIIEIIPFKEVKKYYNLFNKRNTTYYKLLSKYVECKDPKEQKKLNKALREMQKGLKAQQQKLKHEKYNHLLIVFKTSYMATLVYNNYSLSGLQKIRYGSSALINQMGITKTMAEMPLYVMKVPSVQQIKWENVGQSVKHSLAGRIKSFIIAVGIVVFLFLILQEPIRYSMETHTKSKLTTVQQLIPIFISFLLFFLSLAYRNYMVQISKRKNPLNQFQAAKFVLISSMLFHIIFYIIVPVVFFTVDDGISKTIKLFVISEQARTFILMQLLLCIIDIPYQLWKNRKIKCLGDQRQGFKYNQQMLHKIVQYRDFPLELRLQIMFRIWSLAMFYSFYLPYVLYYMLFALIVLYGLEKRNFYLHYTLRRSITLKLQKAFLVYFVNFFCIFQCFSYSMSSFTNKEFDWTMYTAMPVTFTLLVLNFVFWIIVQPYLRRQKQKEDQGLMQKLLMEMPDKAKDEKVVNWAKDVAKQYREGYDKFINGINNEQLDKQIDGYLESLSHEHHAQQDQKQHISKLIEMAESQFDEAIQ